MTTTTTTTAQAPDPDDAYLAIPATLASRRHRQLFTFAVPLHVRVTGRYAATADPITVNTTVPWAEGVIEEAEDRRNFLCLDILATGDGGPIWADPPVGIWVSGAAIASAQVQVPVRLQPGAPRSILEIGQCLAVEQGSGATFTCHEPRGHAGPHRNGRGFAWSK
jgi:hypothetical protein